MRRYYLINDDDLIPSNYYEVISIWGNNHNPRSEIVFYDKYGNWCINDNHMIEIIEDSVMCILKKERPKRFQEIVDGGYYEDGKFNYERCKSSYVIDWIEE